MPLRGVQEVRIQVARVGNHNPVEGVVASRDLKGVVDHAEVAAVAEAVAKTSARRGSAVEEHVVEGDFVAVGSRRLAVRSEGSRSPGVQRDLRVSQIVQSTILGVRSFAVDRLLALYLGEENRDLKADRDWEFAAASVALQAEP
jgi:hypothetical protein